MTTTERTAPADYLVNAGCRQSSRTRATGTIVSIYDGVASGMDTDGGRWQTVCEDHGWIISHDTLALARRHAPVPDEWCQHCMNPADCDESCTDPSHLADDVAELAQAVVDAAPAAEVDAPAAQPRGRATLDLDGGYLTVVGPAASLSIGGPQLSVPRGWRPDLAQITGRAAHHLADVGVVVVGTWAYAGGRILVADVRLAASA